VEVNPLAELQQVLERLNDVVTRARAITSIDDLDVCDVRELRARLADVDDVIVWLGREVGVWEGV
jgi:hypothetical protein